MGYYRPKKEKEKEEERGFFLVYNELLIGILITIICIPTSILLLKYFLENNKWWITITVNISIFWILQYLSFVYIGLPLLPISIWYRNNFLYNDDIDQYETDRILYLLIFLEEFLITSLVSFGIQKLFLSN